MRTVSGRAVVEVRIDATATTRGIASTKVHAPSAPRKPSASKSMRSGSSTTSQGPESMPPAMKVCPGTETSQRKAELRMRARARWANWIPAAAIE